MADPKMMAMQAEIDALKAKLAKSQTITVKVNVAKDGKDEGTVSVYGLQRFPVSLYPDQWRRLLAASDKIRDAIK